MTSAHTPTTHNEENNTADLEEKRRRDAQTTMDRIEKEFYDLKEKFFAEKIEELKREHELIKNGTHQGFLQKTKDLEEIKQHKAWAAQKWKEYQLQNINNIYEAEIKQAEDEYEADKKALRERMMNSTLEKKKKLLEEKTSMSLTDTNERIQTRTLRKRGNRDTKEQGSYKRRLLNPPHINYTLKDSEILEDITLIQKAAASHPVYGKHGPPKVVSDVYTDRGKLHFYNQTFEKNREVFIESKNESGSWQGTIIMINPAEIHIRSPDGTKSRFSIAQLRQGKYNITPAN